jgi:hypothetical protein
MEGIVVLELKSGFNPRGSGRQWSTLLVASPRFGEVLAGSGCTARMPLTTSKYRRNFAQSVSSRLK